MLPGVAIPVAHLHHKDHIFEVICASLDLITVGRAGFQFPKLCSEVFLQQAFSPEALGPRQTSDTVHCLLQALAFGIDFKTQHPQNCLLRDCFGLVTMSLSLFVRGSISFHLAQSYLELCLKSMGAKTDVGRHPLSKRSRTP